MHNSGGNYFNYNTHLFESKRCFECKFAMRMKSSLQVVGYLQAAASMEIYFERLVGGHRDCFPQEHYFDGFASLLRNLCFSFCNFDTQ